MSIEVRTARTFAEVLASIESIKKAWKVPAEEEEIWFRGSSNGIHPLLPGILRPSAVARQLEEATLLQTFQAYAAPLVTNHAGSEWDWYFLAQHHRLPTRLLDWSESLAVALFFAIEGVSRSSGSRPRAGSNRGSGLNAKLAGKSVVWMLEAGTLNEYSVSQDLIVTTPGPTSDPYLPSSAQGRSGERSKHGVGAGTYPIAILPPRSNPRIAAQHGVFTIHGSATVAIEEIASSNLRVKLGAIAIEHARAERVSEELQMLGVNQMVIYADLDHVAEHVKNIYS